MASLSVGDRFSSFDDLERAVNAYGKERFTSFWKREAVTLKTHEKRCPKVQGAAPELKYYLIKYTCIHGGHKYKKRPTDCSRKTKTFKQDCPAFISALLTSDNTALQIKKINMEHNHLVSESFFNSLPKQRRLTKEEEEKVAKLMNLQVSKKLLQQQIISETGKAVTLKDISNIAARHKLKLKTYSKEEVELNAPPQTYIIRLNNNLPIQETEEAVLHLEDICFEQSLYPETKIIGSPSTPKKKRKKMVDATIQTSELQLEDICFEQSLYPETGIVGSPSTPQKKRKEMDDAAIQTSETNDKNSTVQLEPNLSSTNDFLDNYAKYIEGEIRSIQDVNQQQLLKLKIQQMIYYAHKGWLQEAEI